VSIKVRIGTQDVKIKFVPMEDGEFGDFDAFPEPVIRVNLGVPIEAQRMTLLHELLHAISDLYGLDLRESQVRTIEQGLGQVMTEPHIWKYLGGVS
jgi:Zn-dependent peptidase ImmA (M78 family)